jgi:hypothetical protein
MGCIVPDFQSIKTREAIMIFAPNWQQDFKPGAALDVNVHKKLDDSFQLSIDEMSEHQDHRLFKFEF